MTYYYLQDGTVTTAAEIEAAFARGSAILLYYRRHDGDTGIGLMLDGIVRDTRGGYYSVWTTSPETVQAALDAAAIVLC